MMNGRHGGGSSEARVTFVAANDVYGANGDDDADDEEVEQIVIPRFHPQITSGGEIRPFEPEDMQRVLDFEGVAADNTPADGPLLVGEGDDPSRLDFVQYHCCLRGGYVFYFAPGDVDEDSGPYAIFIAPPVGAVPVEGCKVQFPPGGRRVFREHAHTDARSGYELVLLHSPAAISNEDGVAEPMRPPAFLVCDSMGQREKLSNAIKERAALVNKPTLLRAYSAAAAASAKAQRSNAAATDHHEADPHAGAETAAAAGAAAGAAALVDGGESKREKAQRKSSMAHGGGATSATAKRQAKKLQEQVLDGKDDAALAGAVVEFGAHDFAEKPWTDDYFSIHNDFDGPSQCRQMEQWQTEMKKSLKGAVLEQYEYFVQASGEMTTMGKEVTALKNWIETQLGTIKDMREIDFGSAVLNTKLWMGDGSGGADELDGAGGGAAGLPGAGVDAELDRKKQLEHDLLDDDRSIFSEVSALMGGGSKGKSGAGESNPSGETNADEAEENAPPIAIPEWLDDVAEQIGAVAREGRYQDAVELHAKARNEVNDLIDKHERPTLYKLTKKQLAELKVLQRTLDGLGRRICGRLEETLRRKNEALRQSSKRERSDPNHSAGTMYALVSPCAVNDDAHYLQLLCKLGKAQTAAEAYAARRSLLLLEALSERPISGAGSVDLVIYAAQLSQSFFSCLANSVEGFLDLFLTGGPPNHLDPNDSQKMGDDSSLADSSLHSVSMQTKNAPSGAVASVVLWCDAELAKFAAAFGGTRILANLALSPPPRNDGPKKPRVVGGGGGNDAEAEGWKDRKNAIDVAAQCIDQAFLYATQNLDSVGLPLAPRLAEYIRVRLKGCEDEVSRLLDDRWQHLTADWRISGTNGGGGNSSDGSLQHPRSPYANGY